MIISKTPLRISLFGGGTDFPEFFRKRKSVIIGGSIDKYVYVSLSDFFSNISDENIRLFYKKREFVNSIYSIKHKVIREALKKNSIYKNIEIHIISNLPSNTGLGSSSSFSAGLLNCIENYKLNKIKKNNLALKTIKFEREILKESVGYQDQIFATFGGFSKITISKKEKILVSKYKCAKYIENIQNNLFLVYTGIKRSAQKIEKKKIKKIYKNLKFLNQINDISIKADNNIKKQVNPDFIGHYLNKTWHLKKKLEKKVTNKKIDNLYLKGLNAGASGGKLLGAGSGGFILFYVPKKKHVKFFKIMSNQIIKFKFEDKGSVIIKV